MQRESGKEKWQCKEDKAGIALWVIREGANEYRSSMHMHVHVRVVPGNR